MSDSPPISTSEALTEGVRVSVRARYSSEHSDPSRSHWFFLYTIRIENEGSEPVQLLSRYWKITDATGHVEEVRGEGVIGQQPRLQPGEGFEYTSGCPLASPSGSMEGRYQMVRGAGERFEVDVARFEMRHPGALH